MGITGRVLHVHEDCYTEDIMLKKAARLGKKIPYEGNIPLTFTLSSMLTGIGSRHPDHTGKLP